MKTGFDPVLVYQILCVWYLFSLLEAPTITNRYLDPLYLFLNLPKATWHIFPPAVAQSHVPVYILPEIHRIQQGTALKIPRNNASIFFLEYECADGLP